MYASEGQSTNQYKKRNQYDREGILFYRTVPTQKNVQLYISPFFLHGVLLALRPPSFLFLFVD